MNNSIFSEIKLFFSRGTALNKFLLINIAVFVVIKLVKLVFFLSKADPYYYVTFIHWIAVPSSLQLLLIHPWTLLTYMFVHEGFLHIFFNLLVLYWSGRIFTEYLGDRKFISTYILGGLCGAVLYIVAYNTFPVFREIMDRSYLMVASAGVLAILVAIATYLPNYTVFLILIGPVRLKYIALIMVAIDLLSIESDNPGGHIAHRGGAFFGFMYAYQLKRGRNIALFFDKLTGFFSGIRSPKAANLKVAYKKRKKTDEEFNADAAAKQKKIDDILDKISVSGYDSLTKEEKELLFKMSKNL